MLPVRGPSAPGGPLMEAYNALQDEYLKQQKQQLYNQYYGQDIQSQINNRNALTQGYNIENQYAPERLRLANALSQQKYQYNPQIWQSEIANRNALTQGYNIENQYAPERLRLANEAAQQTNALNQQTNPYKINEERVKSQYADEAEKARIDELKARATWRQSGGMGGGVDLKNAQAFNNQLKLDNPDWTPQQINDASNAYYEGRNTFSDGRPLPRLSGQAQDKLTKIQRKNAPAAVQNQAANMDILSSDMNDIDIRPLQAFAGLNGKIEYARNVAAMAAGQEVSQDFRDYLAFKNITSNFAMDALRKGFGTSVVPAYVYATLGKASNPGSSWWNDPQQVSVEWNATKKWVNNNAARLKEKSKRGVTADVSNVKGEEKNASSEKSNSDGSKEKPIKFVRDPNTKKLVRA